MNNKGLNPKSSLGSGLVFSSAIMMIVTFNTPVCYDTCDAWTVVHASWNFGIEDVI
jgi:hypothetical protein